MFGTLTPMEISFLFIIAALILSIVVHEAAHGYAANWLGDPTARLAGRLTLNPVAHIDLFGSIIVPGLLYISSAGILFGWAKPVPYNPYNLKNQRWGEAMVAGAGPLVNIIIALVFGLLIRFSATLGLNDAFLALSSYIVYINILLAFFNMIPIPPLDGSKVLAALLPIRAQMRYQEFGQKFQQFGLIGTFLFIFIFITLLWDPFAALVNSVFALITGIGLSL